MSAPPFAARSLRRLAAAALVGLASGAASGGCAHQALLGRGGGGAEVAAGAAQSTDAARAAAARAFDDGVAAYTRGEKARALAAFERAYASAPAAAVLYNLARVHEELGHDADAARAYVAYLRSGAVSPEQRRAVEESLARIAPRVAWLLVRARGAVTVDGATVPPGAFGAAGATVAVLPGIRSVRAEPLAAPVVVRARAGELLELDFASPEAVLVVAARPVSELRTVLAGP